MVFLIEFGQYATQVKEILNRIADSYTEQSDGIKILLSTVSETEQVIHQIAADSEEAVYTSSKMHSQAKQLKEYVADLELLVGGNKTGR